MWALGYVLAIATLGASQARKLAQQYAASSGSMRSTTGYNADGTYTTESSTRYPHHGGDGNYGDGNYGDGNHGDGNHGDGKHGEGKHGDRGKHDSLNPKHVVDKVTGAVRDVTGVPLDGSLIPIGGIPGEDLSPWAGKCNAIVNLVQILPAGDSIDEQKFAHIKRMVHFMLDGFVLAEKYSHAGVICAGSTPKKLFGLVDPAGRSNVEARRVTANMKKMSGVVSARDSLAMAVDMMLADQRDNAINVVIIHTDGMAAAEDLSSTLNALQNIPRMIPMVVAYGRQIYDNQTQLKSMVAFAECLDLEFCPNFIPARWSPASLISSQLAVKQYIATAVRAVPPASQENWSQANVASIY